MQTTPGDIFRGKSMGTSQKTLIIVSCRMYSLSLYSIIKSIPDKKDRNIIYMNYIPLFSIWRSFTVPIFEWTSPTSAVIHLWLGFFLVFRVDLARFFSQRVVSDM